MATKSSPKQKSITEQKYMSAYLNRNVPNYKTPDWLSATRWRSIVRNQPLAMNCRTKLITSLQNSPWMVKAKKQSEQDKLAGDSAYYTNVLNNADKSDFDAWIDRVWQDVLDLPQGGNTEILRWPLGYMPSYHDGEDEYKCTRNHPLGHVHNIVHIDGSTVYPTYDEKFPLAQTMNVASGTGQESVPQGYQVLFKKSEYSRIVLTPRPEIERRGYGMAPPERAYLALLMLYNGDSFYNKLLVDTPEAGILDLMDMEEDSAIEWLEGLRSLFSGIDPFKIPVLYEHDKPAKWIPFTRPPSEISYNEITLKYAKIMVGTYGLRLSDVLSEESGGSLAGQIRDERSLRLTGFGILREKTRNMINKYILPPYLEFVWVEKDEEALIQKARARLLAAQSMAAMIESGIIDAEGAQKLMIDDGLLPPESEMPEAPPPEAEDSGGMSATKKLPTPTESQPSERNTKDKSPKEISDRQVENELRRTPASLGGVGESSGRVERSLIDLANDETSQTLVGISDFTSLLPHDIMNRSRNNSLKALKKPEVEMVLNGNSNGVKQGS